MTKGLAIAVAIVAVSGLAGAAGRQGRARGQGKIVALESVMENGKIRYEGHVQTKAGKKLAVEVDADGKPYKK